MDETRAAAIDAIVAAYEREMGQLEDTWKALETKAQGTITVGGVFIGFALSFAKELPGTHVLVVRAALTLTLILLVLAVIMASRALRISRVAAGPGGSFIEQLYMDLYQISEVQHPEYRPLLLQNRINALREAVTDRQQSNDRKASHIWWAQFNLGASILTAAALAVTLVWTKPPASDSQGGNNGKMHHRWVFERCHGRGVLFSALAEQWAPGEARE